MARKIAEHIPTNPARPSTGGAYELKDGQLVRLEAAQPDPAPEVSSITAPETPTETGA